MIQVNFLKPAWLPEIERHVQGELTAQRKELCIPRWVQRTRYIHRLVGCAVLIAALGLQPVPVVAQTPGFSDILVVSPESGRVISQEFLTVAGLAPEHARIVVTLDGGPEYEAKTKQERAGLASFSFIPARQSPGTHTLTVSAVTAPGSVVSQKTVQFELIPPTPAPTLFSILAGGEQGRPWIRGVAKNKTNLIVTIDGEKDQEMFLSENEKETVAFAFKPKKILAPGWHSVSAHSVNARSVQSRESLPKLFMVSGTSDRAMPIFGGTRTIASPQATIPAAPTLIDSSVTGVYHTSFPPIKGVVHERLSVKLFIDGLLNQEWMAGISETGVVGFTLRPFLPLRPGVHTIFAVSRDPETGSQSGRSNELRFFVRPRDSVTIVSSRHVWTFPSSQALVVGQKQKPTTTSATLPAPIEPRPSGTPRSIVTPPSESKGTSETPTSSAVISPEPFSATQGVITPNAVSDVNLMGKTEPTPALPAFKTKPSLNQMVGILFILGGIGVILVLVFLFIRKKQRTHESLDEKINLTDHSSVEKQNIPVASQIEQEPSLPIIRAPEPPDIPILQRSSGPNFLERSFDAFETTPH